MLRLTQHGLREIVAGTIILGAIAVGLALVHWALAVPVAVIWIWLISFFRDPDRPIPSEPGLMVSPADGKVTDIIELPDCDLVGGPAVRIGIFLSVFSVHVNRSPCDGRVVAVNYRKGRFINALHFDKASEHNEASTLVLADAGGQPIAAVRQIAGLIARRIICTAAVGDSLSRGQRLGMIKFGSRTELYIPKRLSPQVVVSVGQAVRGAKHVVARVKQ
jgi:phosphatidylserine decarboxylase